MMSKINSVATIASYTAKEILKSKILISTLLIGLALFVLTFVAYSFSYGDPARVAIDFGLGMLSLSSVGIAIFIGVSLLFDEIENRTIYQIISRPVQRSTFLLGKILGLLGVLILNVCILSLVSILLYLFVGGELNILIFWAVLLTIIESVMVLVIVSFFSLITSKVLSVLLTISLYIVGHSISGAQLLSFVKTRPLLEYTLEAYQFFLPGFYKLNIKDFILYKKSLPMEYLMTSFSYGLAYSFGIICLSIYIFNRKDLN